MPTLPIFPGDSRISKALPKISRTDLSPEFLLISTQTTTPPKERKKILQMLTSMKGYRTYLFFLLFTSSWAASQILREPPLPRM